MRKRISKRPEPKQIKSLAQLKKTLKSGDGKDFFILLNYGGRSSKWVSFDGKTFYVINFIDGSEQELTPEELMDEKLTNIGRAIKKGAFYLE